MFTLLFIVLFFSGTVVAQEIDATAPSTTASPFTLDDTQPPPADQPVVAAASRTTERVVITANPEMSHQEMTTDLVLRAIEESDAGPVRKALARAAMRRAIPTQIITDRVTAAGIERGIIPLPPPVGWSTLADDDGDGGDVAMATDWTALFALIMEMMPYILKILAFF